MAVRTVNDEGLVITNYFTDKIKIGKEVWRKK
jgi:hypothetical protein